MKKEMLINVLQPEECRIAIVEDGVLEELYVERTSLESYTGNIYKGKIVNIEPSIQAAFVDFSVGRNGFLHVSDVEPQYYRNLLADDSEDGARDRDREPRQPRGRSNRRAPAPPTEPTGTRDQERPRETPSEAEPRKRPDFDFDLDWPERPDRSEKGRRDRSARRFGAGLTDDQVEEPSPPQVPEPVDRDQPVVRSEPDERRRSWRGLDDATADEPSVSAPPPERSTAEEPRPAPTERSRPHPDWIPDPGDYEPHLPPSRTDRSRPSLSERQDREPTRVRATDHEAETSPSRRTRGRKQKASRPAIEQEIESDLDPAIEAEPTREPSTEEPVQPPQRRGGRDAIRARGGNRERGRSRTRGEDQERPRRRPEKPVEVAEPPALEEEIKAPDRDRTAEPESSQDRERPRPHTRAGEPGYIPRLERQRPFDPTAEPLKADDRPAPTREATPTPTPSFEATAPSTPVDQDEESTDEAGSKRRRRRRGRRRERERPEPETSAEAAAPEAEPRPRRRRARPPARTPAVKEIVDFSSQEIEESTLADDFDFVDQGEDQEDFEAAGTPAVAEVDMEIDPGLQEEIDREIEEIRELERTIGLRGPVETRDLDEEAAGRGRVRAIKPPIQNVFQRGDEVLIQVIKESIGTKGPTLSTYISIPGRYLVLMPGLNRVGVSRKIADEGQRRKLREIMLELNPPKGLGFIVRTAGLDRTKRELARDLAYLLRLWKVILHRIKQTRGAAPIYQESDMIIRTIRDIFSADIDTVWIDERNAYERALEFMKVVMPKFADRIKLYDGKIPLFHKYNLEEEINKIQRRQVPMREGGSLVIEQTEALVAIDVNSGNFRFEDDPERTAYEMNLLAAKEIARQLRLRDLGGVIVNDFIDMRDERHRRGVERALRDAIKRDRARTKVLRMSQFGIIEMTRQRIRPSLKRSVYTECEHCAGSGLVKTVESMAIDVMRSLAFSGHRDEVRQVEVSVSPEVATYLNNRKRRELAQLEADAHMTIHVVPQDGAVREFLEVSCIDSHGNETPILPSPPPPAPAPPPRRRR